MPNPNTPSQHIKPIHFSGPLTLLKPVMPYLITSAIVLFAFLSFWLWGTVYVYPNEIGIVNSKIGKQITTQIVVEEDEQGLRRHVLSEGRYWFFPPTCDVYVIGPDRNVRDKDFLLKVTKYRRNQLLFSCAVCRNDFRVDLADLQPGISCTACRKPINVSEQLKLSLKNQERSYFRKIDGNEYASAGLQNVQGEWGVLGALTIRPGEFGVVNCKYGWPNTQNTLNLGQIVSKGAQGIWKDPIPPGVYRFHPKVYEISVYPEVVIPPRFMGTVTVKQGKELPSGRLLAREGEKGLLEELLPPGKYRLNPELYEVQIAPEIVIGPKEIGVVRALDGEMLPEGEGQQLAEIGQKGTWKNVLPPGTYRLNPRAYEVSIESAVIIKPGQIGVKISKTGKTLPPGEQLAMPGYKGVQRDILVPGYYRLNPVEFEVEIHPEIKITHGHAGVQISKVGKVRHKTEGEKFTLVDKGEQGVMAEVLSPGRYYINPYEREVKIVDVRSHIYNMKGEDAITFPARGFDIRVNTFFEWQINPTRLPEVITTLGGPPEILEKIIRPNARSFGRMEGSKYSAKELVFGDSREEFQKRFELGFREECAKKGILIHRVMIENIEIPENIRRPINEKEIAIQERAKNDQKKETAKSAAALAEEEQKVSQAREKVLAETNKIVAELEANRTKKIAEVNAEKEREIIRIGKESAKVEADKEKNVAEVAAELLGAVAKILKEKELTEANTSKFIAEIGFRQAKFEAKSIEILNDAKAYAARIKYLADGGLKIRIQAWTEVMESLSSNKNLVPDQLIQIGSQGSGGGGSMLEAFMALMTKELAEKMQQNPPANTNESDTKNSK
ncbi:MAG: SPFH domain-containing protein [Planctomycetota bacterium]